MHTSNYFLVVLGHRSWWRRLWCGGSWL